MVKNFVDFLKTFEGFEGKEIIIDYMPSQTGTFCLKTRKADPLYKKFVDGGEIRQYVGSLCMRESYTFDNQRNNKNISFFENFLNWLKKQCELKNFPEDCIDVKAVSGIYIISNDVSTAEYAVDLRFLYIQGDNYEFC